MKDTRYIMVIFWIASALLLAVAGTNFIINPLGIYNAPVIAGFNDVFPAATAFARLKKTEDVKRLKPEVVITGTSRADIGMDPGPRFFPGLVSYNLGVPASTIHEQRRMLEFAHRVHPLKKAVITLDFLSFNARMLESKQFDQSRLTPEALAQPRAFFNTYGSVASLDTLSASVKHLRYIRRLGCQAKILPNGRKTNDDVACEIRKTGAARFFRVPPNAAATETDRYSFAYSDRPGDTTFRHLEAMLDFTRQNGIEVVLFISPMHGIYVERLKGGGHWPLHLEWEKRVTRIIRANGEKYGAAPYPLWDFTAPGAITRTPVPEDKGTPMPWFWDSDHYKPALGDIVLTKILGLPGAAEHPDFGRRIF